MPLYIEQQGSSDNPTLVFLHGFLGNSADWKSTILQLKETFHCITIDLPGHGRSLSAHVSLENGFQNCHQLINDTLTALNINSFTLIGYSMGGRIALDYARTQQDSRLKALILESCHIGFIHQTQKDQRYQNDLTWAKRFATQAVEETLYQWYNQEIFNDLSTYQKEETIKRRSHNYGVYLANMLLSTSLAQQTSALDFLIKTDLKVTYFYGERDTKFQAIASLLPQKKTLKTHCFDGIGHNIHQQIPINYAASIKTSLI